MNTTNQVSVEMESTLPKGIHQGGAEKLTIEDIQSPEPQAAFNDYPDFSSPVYDNRSSKFGHRKNSNSVAIQTETRKSKKLTSGKNQMKIMTTKSRTKRREQKDYLYLTEPMKTEQDQMTEHRLLLKQ